MSRSRARKHLSLGLDMWMLGVDSAMVIGMRTLKLAAGGPAAEREARRMVAEKLRAAAELPAALANAGAATPEALTKAALRHYGRKVRANRGRLARRPKKT